MKKILYLWGVYLGAALFPAAFAQETFPQNGVFDHREGYFAFTNATIYQTFDRKIDNATLIIRNGKVEAVGQGLSAPAGAVAIDLKGKSIYPSFIDMYADYGMPAVDAATRQRTRRGPQMVSTKQGAYAWNEALKPEERAHEQFKVDDKNAKTLREAGFGAVATHAMDGISRGTSTLVTLGNDKEHECIVKEQAAHHLSFSKGSSMQDYPGSLMGSIALLRQTYYDGQWYKGQDKEVNISLDAWNAVQGIPQVFEATDKLEALRAARLGKEFGVTYIIKGAGDEYQRLDEIKAAGSPLIIPLNFPDAYDVEDPFDANMVTLAQMKHWELAPFNPGRLEKAGISFALTSHGLQKKQDFLANLRKAVENGLSETAALKALTHTPATLMGAYDRVGSLEKGKTANFIITGGNVFEKDAKIYHNWVNGKPYVIKDIDVPEWLGNYDLTVGKAQYKLVVSGQVENPEMKVMTSDTAGVKIKHSYNNGLITLSFSLTEGQPKYRLSGVVGTKTWSGRGQDGQGAWIDWKAVYTGPLPPKEDKKGRNGDQKEDKTLTEVTYPFLAYGWKQKPQPQTYLIKNVTVWTNEAEGVLEGADVLVRNGKIAQVGQRINDRSAVVIDGTGKHLTAGIIDEHSHIAISRGVNEGTQASSAEVRIGDVVNSEDINIYRQLSGGVTASQLLHGSANPIGGQSAIIKLRWGASPEEMKIQGAPEFIKFALGENVKQSNWGEENSIRFPQSRMGVEQVYEDHFTRAREYGEKKRSGKPYRKDLDLEALLEILEGKRFITCHSYRQSEINMLMKVAERFGFRINTFTHILEGYKVADKMAAHGVGGSSFSDWWAYKYEVYEAIPYNGALMHEQGVTVAFNSDDAEMARRLNQEAAKAVLFGGVPEEEALKFVTLNPAKLLHLDDRMGSVKVGKDADLVLWSDHPLSVYAKAEKTFVDGIKLFDREEDLALRAEIQQERARLIDKMMGAKQKGGRTQPARADQQFELYHCDDDHDEGK
jgi:imidazolonepropionase-like amidohydrolase